jgi:uncharacterized RDD family membrane protein YckC
LDFVIAAALFSVVVGLISGDAPMPGWAIAVAIIPFLAYFLLTEWLWGLTVGKLLFGLRVRQISGERCTARQIAIRTVLRLVEVNPFCLGELPAAIMLFFTARRQRIGDWLAGTVVVKKSNLSAIARN